MDNKIRTGLTCLFLLQGSALFAQSEEAGSIKVGEADLFPALTLEFKQTDNLYLQSDNPEEGSAVLVKPSLKWVASRKLTKIEAGYDGIFQKGSVSEIDFADHKFSLGVNTELSKRSAIEADVSLGMGHLDLGVDDFTRSDPENIEQVTYNYFDFSVSHVFGAANAKGKIITFLEVDSLSYSNNDALTRNSSRTIIAPTVAFSLRLTGDTRGFLRLGLRDVNRSANGIDRFDVIAGTGLAWQISGKSGGSVAVSAAQASYDSSSEDDQSTVSVQSLLWLEPTRFSRFELGYNRDFYSDGLVQTASQQAIEDVITLDWSHSWSSRVSHKLGAELKKVTRDCPDISDSTVKGRFGVDFQLRRWLSAGLGVNAHTRSIDECAGQAATDFDFSQQGFFMQFTATL